MAAISLEKYRAGSMSPVLFWPFPNDLKMASQALVMKDLWSRYEERVIQMFHRSDPLSGSH